MRIVIALGGNALLRQGDPVTAEIQRNNIRVAVQALLPLALAHELVITHGNGPQVGLLALQGAASRHEEPYPLDVLDAETEGMIGYLIEQELGAVLPSGRDCATLLTQVEVDARDPAFDNPSKPIGPDYSDAQAEALRRQRGWQMARVGAQHRRVVASPKPLRILEMRVIELLVRRGVIVICAGGGGIPVVRREDGSLQGVEAVIDKDRASALLAGELGAEALLMLTDVDAVYIDWPDPAARAVRRISSEALRDYRFAVGSMGPKVEAAADFVEICDGVAGIGRLQDAGRILHGEAGTLIVHAPQATLWW